MDAALFVEGDISDTAGLGGGEIAALNDDIGVRFEQTDQLLARRHRLAIEYPMPAENT